VRIFSLNTLLFTCLSLKLATTAIAKPSYPPELSDAVEVTYKTANSSDLKLWIFKPDGHKKGDKKPAILFFFGGGWRSGSPSQFERQCQYLATRGMVAITADYRVSSRHGTMATACVEDGKSAIRWIRTNADKLGIDSQKVAVGGGSAGGHIAATTGTIKGFEAGKESIKVSSKPDALVLFNPAVALDDIGSDFIMPQEKKASLPTRLGTSVRKLSPYHHIDKSLPPTIIFHGTQDSSVPFLTVQLFQKEATRLGLKCRLIPFADKPHGFFNWGRFENEPFRKSMKETDRFLSELGWLKGKPTIDQFISQKQPLQKQ
jgi:acetyl esterase